MTTYKLVRVKADKLYPLFVECERELPMGEWLEAGVGEMVDSTHVKGRGQILALRPGWHSCAVPFANWIGKKGPNGRLYQRKDNVWVECKVEGERLDVKERWGLRTVPEGWYYFRTNPLQPYPWIISRRIFISHILPQTEVERICREHGLAAQPVWNQQHIEPGKPGEGRI